MGALESLPHSDEKVCTPGGMPIGPLKFSLPSSVIGTGGDRGLTTDSDNPIDEIRIGGDDTSGYAPVDVHEVVVTEGRDLSRLAAYRTLRVAPLYGLAIDP